MMNWQWQNLLACLSQVALHAQDSSCPCNQVHLGDDGKHHAEYCLAKHLIEFWSLSLETALMSPGHREMLEVMAGEANEFIEKAKTIYCKGGLWPDLAQWARDCRKKIEPVFFACHIKAPAPAPPPVAVDTTPAPAMGAEELPEVTIEVEPVYEVSVVAELADVIPAPAPCADVPSPKKPLIYRYRSPYRPLPMNYLPDDSEGLYDFSTIGPWTAQTIYAFGKPLPKALIKQWDLETVTVPAPAPGLVGEVCAGLQEGKETHEHFLGVPPDPKTGDHTWHRKWIDVYSKAQTVVGCGGR